MVSTEKNQKGMVAFTFAMIASLLSNIGTHMTQFAIVAWVYQESGSAMNAGILATAAYGMTIVAGIFAGALVDRMNRKMLIIGSDILSAVATVALLLVHLTGPVSLIWLVLYGVILGISGSIQFPAYMSSVMSMVAPEQQQRANSMFQTAWALSTMLSPVLAGVLLGMIGLSGILYLDLGTFAVIVLTVALLRIPQPEPGPKQTLWRDTVDGFQYLFARVNLLWFVLVLTAFNVAFGAYEGLFRPMLLAFTDSETIAGTALIGYGLGNVVCGFFMMAWKGPKNRAPLALIAWAAASFFGFIVSGYVRTLEGWLIAGFLQGFMNNIAVVLTIGIWQSNVEPAFQGRVFSIMKLVGQITIPPAVALATIFSDKLAVPAFQPDGALAGTFGSLLGTGDGAGMSFVLIVLGLVFGTLFPLAMLLIPGVRNIDKKQAEAADGAAA